MTFPCDPRIFAEFGMVAFTMCSATSFGVFHIFFAWGKPMQKIVYYKDKHIVPTALYGAEAWGMRSAERRKVNVLEMKC